MNRLPDNASCRCHETTIKWCARHGQPLKLKPGDRVVNERDLFFLQRSVDPTKANEVAAMVRRVMAGG